MNMWYAFPSAPSHHLWRWTFELMYLVSRILERWVWNFSWAIHPCWERGRLLICNQRRLLIENVQSQLPNILQSSNFAEKASALDSTDALPFLASSANWLDGKTSSSIILTEHLSVKILSPLFWHGSGLGSTDHFKQEKSGSIPKHA